MGLGIGSESVFRVCREGEEKGEARRDDAKAKEKVVGSGDEGRVERGAERGNVRIK